MLNRFTYMAVLLLLALGGYVYLEVSRDSPQQGPTYVGVGRCRACHEPTSIGNQFGAWRSTAHSRAYDTLFTLRGQTILNRSGRELGWCLGCHATDGRRSNRNSIISSEGVGCEACHGPGSRYARYDVMVSTSRFHGAGGATGSLNDCFQCHRSPSTPDTSSCPVEAGRFNVDSAWLRIEHPLSPDFSPRDLIIKP